MTKKFNDKDNWKKLNEYEKKFLTQKQFPSFPSPYKDRMQPIMHVGYQIFIRNKFIYLGLIRSLKEKDLFVAYSLLKSYWENVAVFGYYFLTVSQLLKDGNKEKAFAVSKKMGLGGRGFPTEEMIKKKGHKVEDYKLPNIYTMMDRVDKDWKKILKDDDPMFRTIYDEQIAEGGHTTFTGLQISGKRLPDKSLLPDLEKSWDDEDGSSLLNLTALSTIVFYYYWDRFQKLKD